MDSAQLSSARLRLAQYSTHLQGDRVTREGLGDFQLVPARVVEAAFAGAQNDGGNEGGGAARGVHDAAAGKVDHAGAPERVAGHGREEPVLTPDGVHNHGVDEPAEQHAVAQVGRHLAALGQGAGHDGGAGGREGELEEPEGVAGHRVRARLHGAGQISHEEVRVADERLALLRVLPAKGEGVAHRVEAHGRPTRVQQVLQHGVLHVLQPHRPGAQHGKARLHEKHQRGTHHEEQRVHALLHARAAIAAGSYLQPQRPRDAAHHVFLRCLCAEVGDAHIVRVH
eukprot:scaffold149895_cov88-Attheya_sp.AAC.1